MRKLNVITKEAKPLPKKRVEKALEIFNARMEESLLKLKAMERQTEISERDIFLTQ